jgi:hypothetical protein
VDIFSLVIIFFVISAVVNIIKKLSGTAKKAQTQTQEQFEATKPFSVPKPAPKPAPKREDFRFPPIQKPVPQSVFQEGGNPNAKMTEYTPITPSVDLDNRFTAYKGSLDATSTEGTGYETEAYDLAESPYGADQASDIQVLPESFSRNALLQAVVMSEVLQRPETIR